MVDAARQRLDEHVDFSRLFEDADDDVPVLAFDFLCDVVPEGFFRDGVDGLLVGGSDLSTTMGIPGQSTNPDFLAAIDKVIASAHDAGKISGLGGVYDEGIIPDFVNRGMRFFLGGAALAG